MKKHLTTLLSAPAMMRIRLLLLCMLFFIPSAYADDMKDSKYYTMTEYNDHMYFSVLLTDLNKSNTWAKEGYIKAVSGNQTLKLVTVYTKEMSSDYNENYNVFANNELKGGVAYLSNATGGAKELSYTNEQFWVWKGANNDRTYAKIDYYYPPELAGKSWTFYYYYKHNNNSWYEMKLGTAYCSPTMGLEGFNANDFTIERTDVRKMEVTLPALPDDVPSKLKENRKHIGKYSFTFNYLLYDGSIKMQKEAFDCESSMEKTYSISIPIEAANFKSVDMSVDVQDALYCTGSDSYFWNNNSNISKSNIFASVPQPDNIGAEYLQFDRKVDIAWQTFHDYGNGYKYIEATYPYIYRLETDKNGQKMSGEKWNFISKRSEIGTTQNQTYTDNGVEANKYYRYLILNVPKAWAGSGIISDSQLDSPSDETIDMLGHVISDVVSTTPTMSIYDLSQDISVVDQVVLKWKYSRVPVSAQTVRFQLMRRVSGTDNWNDLDQVQGDSNPKAGTTLSYSDNTIASNRVRYDYKVQLSINDGANVFESDVITAGVIAGTTVTSIDATKGQHSDLVRVTWKVKQVGTANTNFELYRRYVNSGNEFMKIYATSGNSDSYSYEDNTAQPGYYYEYKIESYAGDKDSYDDTSYQNALSAIGFCQSTGVISGRVTFGSAGTSVDEVRMTLRGSDTDEGGDIQQFSQRVDGPSTGISWEANETEVAKLFSKDRDYTVEMFARPDGSMSRCVLCEIPSFGRIRLQKTRYGMTPYLEKYGDATKVKKEYSSIRRYAIVLWRSDSEVGSTLYIDHVLSEIVYSYSEWKQHQDDYYLWAGYQVAFSNEVEVNSYTGETYKVNMVVYYIDEPLDKTLVSEKSSWIGTIYSSTLGATADTYNLISLQKTSDNIVLTVNDKSQDSKQLSQWYDNEYEEETIPLDISGIEGALVRGDMLYRLENRWTTHTQDLLDNYAEESQWIIKNYTETITQSDVDKPFSVGGTTGVDDSEAYRGNLCEVRVWDHMLTSSEHDNTKDRLLSGNETGLKLYWPMSEGIDRLVVDASYLNDVPNGRHATVGNNIKSSKIVPSDNMLSRYAVTNANGEYTLRGIPFVGSGTTYTITPSKSIHVFSPTSRNGFVSAGSLTLNNYDFTDQSSFIVRGKITYKDSNIPADSIMFKIDGTLSQKDGKQVMTDANGEYEISVPIGSHTIEPYKEGHVFNSFPADGSAYNFYQEEIINFFDNTLVNVTGRINGGFTDKDAPLGFRQSTNRLGKATLKLSLGKESQCSFNYLVDDYGNGEFGTEPIPVASATEYIKSTSYRSGGSHDDTYFVYIKTDSLTGEFSALLPPLKYVVNSITFDGGTDYDNESVFKENLPVIDATNTISENLRCDSIDLGDENYAYYYYSGKLIRQFRTTPTISVTQNDMENGAFGVRSVSVRDNITNEEVDVPVVEITESGYKYLYGHPFFVQGDPYEFTINVSEQYTNLDTKEVFKEVPQDAIVNISNEASSTAATIVAQPAKEDGKDLNPGDVYDVDNLEVYFDNEDGNVGYGWVAGFPSLSEGYLRNLTISVNVDGRTTMWKAPDSHTDALDMVVTGGITTGTNFVTGAPDQIDMILRRPPGSTAFSQWTSDSIYVRTKTTTTTSSHSGGGGVNITFMPSIEYQIGAVACFKNSKNRFIYFDTNIRRNNAYDDISVEKEMNSYSVSTSMKTPSGIKLIQNNGDTYIGRATNLMFGQGRYVGLIKQNDGTYALGDESSLCTSESYKTSFVLPQQYVEKTLIPNWEAIIKSHLKYVPALTEDYCKKIAGEVNYYTTLKEGDYGYGSANSDEEVWSSEQHSAAGGHPSYLMVDGIKRSATEEVTDSIEWCNQQISKWKQTIRSNEKDKLKAFDDESTYKIGNFSIAGGTVVSQTTKRTIVNSEDIEHTKTSWNLTNDSKIGATFNDVGVVAILNFVNSGSTEKIINESITDTKSTTWQISDASPATALSVDVYKSPAGHGPIFRTLGGQTCNPYEGATYTKYYEKDTELDKATMRIENPKLSVVGSSELSNIPTGTKAEFKLLLSNESETNNTCTYVLEVIEGSNPNGAVLTMDGLPIGNGRNGRSVLLGGNESITKTLCVEQSNQSVIDYEDIRLTLRSELDVDTYSDPVTLKVHFIPSSAIVDISVDHTILNYDDYKKNNGVIVTLTNLDRQDKGLEGVRIQYRKKGLDTWSLAKEWKVTPADYEEQLPEGNSFSAPVSFPEDGVYELRGQTFGTYGPDEVTYSTAIIEVTQDILGPKILGMPYPEMGFLTYDTRNDAHVRFNETINTNALSKTDNFRIVGDLNNSVQEGQLPDVAVQLNGSEISTQSTYHISNSDIAIEGWFYRQGDGTILSIGTEDNALSISTQDGGKVVARVGEKSHSVETDVVLPADTWNYIAMSCHLDPENNGQGTISALYANADMKSPVYIVEDRPIMILLGDGKMSIGGDGMTGMMRDLAVWNIKKSVKEMYESREENKANYTPGLLGYWKMDEGHGTTVVDRVNSRNMVMPSESWYINNRNLASHLDGFGAIDIDINGYTPRSTDNYAVEFWFRSDMDVDYGWLLNLGNDISVKVVDNQMYLSKLKHLEAGVIEEGYMIHENGYMDNQWHHFALNVRRGSNAIIYIDGEAIKTIPESEIPAPNRRISVGGMLEGSIDDIRIWNAALTGNLIAERRYERLDSTYAGLVGYFPMESIHRIESGTVISEYSLENMGTSNSFLSIMNPNYITQAVNAPAMLPGSQRLRLDEKEFSYVASDNEIYIQFPDNMLSRMDGNEFTVTISNVKDQFGNNSEPIDWMFNADFALLNWYTPEMVDIIYNRDGSLVYSEVLVNLTSSVQTYEILNLPTWISVREPIGVCSDVINNIEFTILPSAPIGTHTVYIYVSDSHGIKRSMCRRITVTGDEPEWSFNASQYESNMALIGQLYISNKICENPLSKIGAFDELGACRGIAKPTYMDTRDAYYLNMYVYGDPGSQYKKLTFKMYDASTGIFYPNVHIMMPDSSIVDTLEFASDALYGTYDTPLIFRASEDMQQTVKLPRDWSWMSIFVQPSSTAIANVLPKEKNTLTGFKNIKSQFAFSSVDTNGNIVGEVTDIVPGNMYKMQTAKSIEFNIIGKPIDVTDTTQTIHHDYNWIGTLSSEIMSPAEAFADLNPEKNDMIKNRSQVSMYRGDGIWEGTLKSIVPGEGYIYYSRANYDKTFHYPKLGSQTASYAPMFRSPAQPNYAPPVHYTPVDPYTFPDNMNVIAVVVKDGQLLNGAEIGAFINGECRGAICANEGSDYYFLTVMGSSSEDQNRIVELRVFTEGTEYVVDRKNTFINDNVLGDLDEPYVLDLDDATGVTSLFIDSLDDDGWYTIQGYKLEKKPIMRGVYIHKGVKVVIE